VLGAGRTENTMPVKLLAPKMGWLNFSLRRYTCTTQAGRRSSLPGAGRSPVKKTSC